MKCLATKCGTADGAERASGPRYEDFDPTGGFIRRRELIEDDRAAYVRAYEIGYKKALRVAGRAPQGR
jgi:hypothetical protein